MHSSSGLLYPRRSACARCWRKLGPPSTGIIARSFACETQFEVCSASLTVTGSGHVSWPCPYLHFMGFRRMQGPWCTSPSSLMAVVVSQTGAMFYAVRLSGAQSGVQWAGLVAWWIRSGKLKCYFEMGTCARGQMLQGSTAEAVGGIISNSDNATRENDLSTVILGKASTFCSNNDIHKRG